MRTGDGGGTRVGGWPVSVKGVLLRNGCAILLRNERAEWELPGGKLDPGESPAECVHREFAEELGLPVDVIGILDSWVYEVLPGTRVLVVTYGCTEPFESDVQLCSDHPEYGWFAVDELKTLALPDGYQRSIREWSEDERSRRGFDG